MSNPAADAKSDFTRAELSMCHHQSWMMTFQAACMRRDWEAAEKARDGVLGSMDSFMDNFIAGHKRMESA